MLRVASIWGQLPSAAQVAAALRQLKTGNFQGQARSFEEDLVFASDFMMEQACHVLRLADWWEMSDMVFIQTGGASQAPAAGPVQQFQRPRPPPPSWEPNKARLRVRMSAWEKVYFSTSNPQIPQRRAFGFSVISRADGRVFWSCYRDGSLVDLASAGLLFACHVVDITFLIIQT